MVLQNELEQEDLGCAPKARTSSLAYDRHRQNNERVPLLISSSVNHQLISRRRLFHLIAQTIYR